MTPDLTDLVAAAIKLRIAVDGEHADNPGALDRLHHRAKLRSLEEHMPALFEAIGDVVVCVNPPPAAVARMLHPSSAAAVDEPYDPDIVVGGRVVKASHLEARGVTPTFGPFPEEWSDDVGHVHPSAYPDPEGDAA